MNVIPLGVLKRDMIRVLARVEEKGWVANHDGNASIRIAGNRYLITPTSFSKADIRERDLLVVNQKSQVLQGSHRPFSEMSLHKKAFELRPDVKAVLHSHAPNSVALSMVGKEVNPCLIAEAVVSLGDRIPTAPYTFPGTEASLDALSPLLPYYDVVVLGNHGVISVGVDLEQAFLRMELCEHLATIQLKALSMGEPMVLPRQDVDRLLAKRKKGGLGPEARGLELPSSTKKPQLVGPCSGPIA